MNNLYSYKIVGRGVNGMSYEEHEKLVRKGAQMYADGEKVKDIAKKLGVHETTVVKWAKKCNVTRKNRRKYSIELVDKMVEEYETTNIPTTELAEKYGMSYHYCKNLISENGGRRSIRADHKNGIEVVQLTEDMKVVGVFSSISRAEKETGISASAIFHAVNKDKRHKRAGDYIWMKMTEYSEIF